jgi:AcrR family transcriptional regulator
VNTVQPKKKPAEGGGTMCQRLIEAARAEFGEKGIEAATTRGIAERAGCNEVTLFRNFESKQKLLQAVVAETSEEFRVLSECRSGFSGDLLADLSRFAEVYDDSLQRCEGMARAMIGESRRRPTMAKELIGNVLEPLHRAIADYLEQRKPTGEVRADLNGMAFAEILTSALMGGLLRRGSGLSTLDRQDWIRETVGVMVRGIGGR